MKVIRWIVWFAILFAIGWPVHEWLPASTWYATGLVAGMIALLVDQALGRAQDQIDQFAEQHRQ